MKPFHYSLLLLLLFLSSLQFFSAQVPPVGPTAPGSSAYGSYQSPYGQFQVQPQPPQQYQYQQQPYSNIQYQQQPQQNSNNYGSLMSSLISSAATTPGSPVAMIAGPGVGGPPGTTNSVVANNPLTNSVMSAGNTLGNLMDGVSSALSGQTQVLPANAYTSTSNPYSGNNVIPNTVTDLNTASVNQNQYSSNTLNPNIANQYASNSVRDFETEQSNGNTPAASLGNANTNNMPTSNSPTTSVNPAISNNNNNVASSPSNPINSNANIAAAIPTNTVSPATAATSTPSISQAQPQYTSVPRTGSSTGMGAVGSNFRNLFDRIFGPLPANAPPGTTTTAATSVQTNRAGEIIANYPNMNGPVNLGVPAQGMPSVQTNSEDAARAAAAPVNSEFQASALGPNFNGWAAVMQEDPNVRTRTNNNGVQTAPNVSQ